jgi:cyclopropane fatty-acyl-phospholipid synthase-like methyltransferase
MKHCHWLAAICLAIYSLGGCASDGPTEHDSPDHSAADNAANTHMHQTPLVDLIARLDSSERDAWQKPELVIAALGNLRDKTVMDIGCGSGYFARYLVAAGARVICADVSTDLQAYVTQWTREDNITADKLVTRLVPFDSPGLITSEVDLVLIVNTYHHIENRSDYFAKVRRGIKPGGELVVVDFFKRKLPIGPPQRMKLTPDDVTTELRAAGFAQFQLDTTTLNYQYLIHARP